MMLQVELAGTAPEVGQPNDVRTTVLKIVQRTFVSRVVWVGRLGESLMFNLTMSRLISAVIVLTYGVLFWLADPPRTAADVVVELLTITGYFLLPLACIWYGDEMGEYWGTPPGPTINRPTPGWMVKVGGWFLLFLPAIVALFVFQIS